MVLTLQELCVRNAIDNVAHLGDVGDTDSRLLKVILPHCTADQLLHIETCTKVFVPPLAGITPYTLQIV